MNLLEDSILVAKFPNNNFISVLEIGIGIGFGIADGNITGIGIGFGIIAKLTGIGFGFGIKKSTGIGFGFGIVEGGAAFETSIRQMVATFCIFCKCAGVASNCLQEGAVLPRRPSYPRGPSCLRLP